MRFKVGTVTLLVSQLACAAATAIDGLYSTVFAGYADTPNNIYATYQSLTRSNAVYNAGYDVGGAIGYKSTPMRYEGEITYLNTNLTGLKINQVSQTGVSGYNSAVFAMANLYYDFHPLVQGVQPFLGGGIGYGWLSNNFNATGPNIATQLHLNNYTFAYQGSAGIAIHFVENYSLTAAYRYVATPQLSNIGKSFQANLASLGVTYRFDESSYK